MVKESADTLLAALVGVTSSGKVPVGSLLGLALLVIRPAPTWHGLCNCVFVLVTHDLEIEVHDILAENFLPDLKPREDMKKERKKFFRQIRFLERNS